MSVQNNRHQAYRNQAQPRTQRQDWASFGFAFGQRLRELRLMRNLSQERLAALANLSRNQISNLERNDNNSMSHADPRMSTIYALAQALDLPPAVLMPSATEPVQAVCPKQKVEQVELTWPNSIHDLLPLDARHLLPFLSALEDELPETIPPALNDIWSKFWEEQMQTQQPAVQPPVAQPPRESEVSQ